MYFFTTSRWIARVFRQFTVSSKGRYSSRTSSFEPYTFWLSSMNSQTGLFAGSLSRHVRLSSQRLSRSPGAGGSRGAARMERSTAGSRAT